MPQQPRAPAVTSHVVTGAARGVGRTIAEQLARTGPVVVVDLGRLDWEHPDVRPVSGDASDPEVAREAAGENHFLAHGRSGSIVNLSSHQAQRPVRGALPYATTPRW